MLLSYYDGDHYSRSGPLDLRVVVRIGDVELSDEGHHKRLHLDHTIREAGFSVPGEIVKGDQRTRISTRCSS